MRRIQETIAQEFGNKTLLTIAHRLLTIIGYDRVLCMESGQIVELDTPINLFRAKGTFHSMCQRSGITLADIEKAQKKQAFEQTCRNDVPLSTLAKGQLLTKLE